jgi:RNA polymerase subunit RPABC4/transcription elongation factor Spt4
MALTPCPSCHRHVKEATAACPFCGAEPASQTLLSRIVTTKTVAGAVGIGLALSLCACYGPPPRDRKPPTPDPSGQNVPEQNTKPNTADDSKYAAPPPVEQPR